MDDMEQLLFIRGPVWVDAIDWLLSNVDMKLSERHHWQESRKKWLEFGDQFRSAPIYGLETISGITPDQILLFKLTFGGR